jgi:signal transduction histidine kinase
MSHELRTPLNAIQGYADLLLEGRAENDPDRHDLEAILRATKHLLGLVESVLDLNQLQTGRFDIRIATVDVVEVLGEIADAVSEQAQRNKTTVVVDVEDGLTVRSDLRMLRQIVFNLAHNACRFTFRGQVRIAAHTLDATDFAIVVSDDGIGMTAAQVQAATEPFWQADASTTRRYDGAGVGLAVCNGLAEALGGSLTIESRIGKGATVTVVLPRESEAASSWLEEDDEPTVLLR